MNAKTDTSNWWRKVMFLGFCLLLLLPTNNSAQENGYKFVDIDTTEAYRAVYYARTVNYLVDHAVVDSLGHIYFVFVDNYKLYCHKSEDGGSTWSEEQIITGNEGKLYKAMIGLTQAGKRIIVYSINTGFSNGNVGFGSEFRFNTYGAVETDEGWQISTLYTNTSNFGYTPFGMITIKDGTVHALLHRDGWYNYGGEIYETVYDPVAKTWSGLLLIKKYSDRPVDLGTNYMAKLAEGEANNIICMFQRHGTASGYINVEVIERTPEGVWQAPVEILKNNTYSTYNRFELDYDRHGHTYMGYFEPQGENGPQLFLAHNSTTAFEKHEVFEVGDTLRKMDFVPIEGALLIYCNFVNRYPVVLRWSESGLTLENYLPAFTQADSMDVMRFHYHIPRKNNFSSIMDLLAITNRGQGRDPNNSEYVLPYPLVFVRANLQEPIVLEIICPADTTVGCDQILDVENTGMAAATGNCDSIFVPTFTDTIVDGDCPQSYVIKRHWQVSDDCSNEQTCIQIITVVDTVAPVLICPDDTLINCSESLAPSNLGTAMGTDNCDADLEATYTDSIVDGDCAQSYVIKRHWQVSDDCSNAQTCIQIITVVDTVAPVLICPADTTIDCRESIEPTNLGTAKVTDNCDDAVTIVHVDAGNSAECPTLIKRTWSATDECGNVATCTQTINVIDNVGVNVVSDTIKVTVYPNPASDYVVLKGVHGIEDKTIKIYSVWGVEVKTVDIRISNKVKISDLPSGFYLIKNSADKTIGKFVKR